MRAVPGLVLLLLSASLPGCVGGPSGSESTPVDSGRSLGFDGLDSPNAVRTTDGEGTRTFRFEGRLAELVPNPKSLAFEVDGRVGFVQLNLSSGAAPIGTNGIASSGVVASIHDEKGRRQCDAAGGALVEGCSVPVPPGVAAEATWSVAFRYGGSGSAQDSSFSAEVTLHAPAHLVRGDPASGTDSSIRFRIEDTQQPGTEPAIGVLGDGAVFVQEGLVTLRSDDKGRTWQVVSPALNFPTTLDPMMKADPWTGTVYVSQLYIGCSYLSWTQDHGQTWSTNPAACGVPVDDHEKLGLGPPGIPAGRLPTVHYGFSTISPVPMVWSSRSLDGGRVFAPAPVAGPHNAQEARNTGPIAADRHGNVVMPLVLCQGGGAMGVGVSHDQGATYQVQVVDREPRRCEAWDSDMSPSVDSEGTFYVAYHRPSRIKYVFSRDGGRTWSEPRAVPSDDRGSFVHVAAAAGDAGRLGIAYRATPDSHLPSDYVPGWAAWHLYATLIENASSDRPAFRTSLVNPATDPVHRGPLCTGWGALGYCPTGARVLLDFIDAAAGPEGELYIAYPDSCHDGCPTPADARRTKALVAVLEDGPPLFAEPAPWARAGAH